MKKMSFVMLTVLLFSSALIAQEASYLSVQEAIKLATYNNSQVKMAELDKEVSTANYRQTDAIFLPQIDLGYTAMVSNNPLNAFGFLLQQERVTAADFDPAKLNHPGASRNYNAQIEAKMPLLNLDMIYARKGAKAQEQVYEYKSARTVQHIQFEVEKVYTQLQFSYEAKDILLSSLEDVKKIYKTVQNFHQQGLVQKSDVLNAQVQVNTLESALTKAESNIYNASDGLRLLMGVDASTTAYTTDNLTQATSLDTQMALSENRADIMAYKKAVDATNMMVKSSKMNFLPRINAFGTYAWNDSEIFKFNADSYLLGINLSWTVFSGNQNRSKWKSATFQRNKMQHELDFHIKQSQLELHKTQRELNDLQVEINKQKASVEQADEALRILSNRHSEGLANTTDLLMSQAQLSQQKLLLAQAIMSYNITQAYLNFLSKTE